MACSRKNRQLQKNDIRIQVVNLCRHKVWRFIERRPWCPRIETKTEAHVLYQPGINRNEPCLVFSKQPGPNHPFLFRKDIFFADVMDVAIGHPMPYHSSIK